MDNREMGRETNREPSFFAEETVVQSEPTLPKAPISTETLQNIGNKATLSSNESMEQATTPPENLKSKNASTPDSLDKFTGVGLGSNFESADKQINKGAVFSTGGGESYDDATLEAISAMTGETPNNMEALLINTGDQGIGAAVEDLRSDFELAQIENGQAAAGLSQRQAEKVVKNQEEAAKNNAQFVEQIVKRPAYEAKELERIFNAGSREILDAMGYRKNN